MVWIVRFIFGWIVLCILMCILLVTSFIVWEWTPIEHPCELVGIKTYAIMTFSSERDVKYQLHKRYKDAIKN